MKHPKGAVQTTEEMEQLLGRAIYLTLPPDVGNSNTGLIRVSKFLIKLTPVKISLSGGCKRAHPDNNLKNHYYLHTVERVNAAQVYAIATNGDWSVTWGSWDHEYMMNYYFANYWHAYAFTLQLQELELV